VTLEQHHASTRQTTGAPWRRARRKVCVHLCAAKSRSVASIGSGGRKQNGEECAPEFRVQEPRPLIAIAWSHAPELFYCTVSATGSGAVRRVGVCSNLVDGIAMGDTWTDGHGTVLYGTCGHGHRQKDEVNCTVLYCTGMDAGDDALASSGRFGLGPVRQSAISSGRSRGRMR